MLLKILNELLDKENKKENEQLEQEMEAYNLEEWQKELVRKGEYNPCDFEEDGPFEECDYYYDESNDENE